jgi:ABC-type nitrate/sulfonate/bicarbonate transport system permease component
VAVIVIWEILTRVLRVPTYLMPGPVLIVNRWWSDIGFFLLEGGVTLLEALAGVATIGLFGIAMIGLITLLERRVLFWSGDEVAQ